AAHGAVPCDPAAHATARCGGPEARPRAVTAPTRRPPAAHPSTTQQATHRTTRGTPHGSRLVFAGTGRFQPAAGLVDEDRVKGRRTMQTSRAAGESVLAREYQRVVTRAFSKLSQSQEDTALEAVRRIVSDSWQRSLSALPPTGRDSAELGLDTDELRRLRAEGPLARALPIVRRLLIEPARDTGLVVAIGDAQGRLLWVEGDHQSL